MRSQPSPRKIAKRIIRYLRTAPIEPDAGYVRNMPSGTLALPPEIWLPTIGAWLRDNGSSASFDRARGRVYFGIWQAWRLRAAILIWIERKRITEGT